MRSRISHRTFVLGLSAAFLVLFIAYWNQSLAADKRGTITILVPAQYGLQRPEIRTSDAEILQQLFEEYQQKVAPGVKIQLEELVVPAGVLGWDVIRTRAIAGNIPDMVAFQPVTTLMSPDLFYQFPRDALDKPNPYSSNKRWFDDFPYNGLIFASYPGAIPGTYWAVGMTRLGGHSVVGVAYNRDMFGNAGIGPAPPKTWAEWMDWHKKLKTSGVVPFDAFNHVAGSCCSVWFHSQIYDNLIEDHHGELEGTASGFFGEKTDGMLNPRWGVYLFKTKKWSFDDEHMVAYFRILKDWSQYFQPGFLGQTTTDLFLGGKAAMRYVHVNNIRPLRKQLEGKFRWGTFYPPSITKETWSGAPGLPQRAHAASGQPGGFAFGGFFMVPQKTVKEGKLEMVTDLLQWLTASAQLERFNNTREPKGASPDATVEQVYADDPDMREYYRFYYEPSSIRGGKRYGADEWWHMVGIGAETGFHKTNQALLAGQFTPEQAAKQLHQIAVEAGQRWVAENPGVKPSPDTWK
jgi:ABC-type glycerol-3-phosphate transport system substrate-binding protein